MENKANLPDPGSVKLTTLFGGYLDRIYCAKSHLLERLPELASQAHFSDLKNAINETVEDVEKQIARMKMIYLLLGNEPSDVQCSGLVAMVEDAYDDIHRNGEDAVMQDMAILFYLQNIESVEIASFQVLQMAAVNMKDKQIEQLIRENFDEAKEDRALFVSIIKKYIQR